MKHANPRPQMSAVRFHVIRAVTMLAVFLALAIGATFYQATRPTVLVSDTR